MGLPLAENIAWHTHSVRTVQVLSAPLFHHKWVEICVKIRSKLQKLWLQKATLGGSPGLDKVVFAEMGGLQPLTAFGPLYQVG